jgi:hypothetical protein
LQGFPFFLTKLIPSSYYWMNRILCPNSNMMMCGMCSERYIAKSDQYIVMVSTPNALNGLFDKIKKEPFDTSSLVIPVLYCNAL